MTSVNGMDGVGRGARGGAAGSSSNYGHEEMPGARPGFSRQSNARPGNSGRGRQGQGGAAGGDRENRPGPSTYVPEETPEDELIESQIEMGPHFVDLLDRVRNDESIVQRSGATSTENEPIRRFVDAKLADQILANVKESGYELPTPVQQYAIPVVMSDKDVMACAQTGSGKTAAFLLPILSKMLMRGMCTPSASPDMAEPVCLILAPTRELVDQIKDQARKFGRGTAIQAQAIYGGTSVGHSLGKLKDGGCNVLVAAAGRLMHFVNDGHLSLGRCRFLVLDEADKMLQMGFEQDIRMLVQRHLPPKGAKSRQTMMFSATFPKEIQHLARDFLDQYVFLSVGPIGSANPDVNQTLIKMHARDKNDRLLQILRDDMEKYQDEHGESVTTSDYGYKLKTLVFVERKRNADFLASLLSQNSLTATSIHGDRTQQQRELALRNFKSGKMPILIATAVAARGLDIRKVDHVINFDLPQTIDEYVHRIGRTARVGNPGRATSFYDADVDRDLADGLVTNLSHAEQEVPAWLEEEKRRAANSAPSRPVYHHRPPNNRNKPGDDWGDNGKGGDVK